jgi:hypothetical protein
LPNKLPLFLKFILTALPAAKSRRKRKYHNSDCLFRRDSVISGISQENIYYKRFGSFKDYFGLEIRDTEHYFSIRNLSKYDLTFMIFPRTDISTRLYYFMSGKNL